jgi:hypothetical protein
MTKKPTNAARRHKGVSLHIGLNLVSPAHYGGWSGELVACEFDAHDMAALARARGMKARTLITKKATRSAALAAIRAAARSLKSGDLFFLSYSGHGGQLPDVSGDEPDKQDETWCLYDGQLIDDELYAELGAFAAGVRILVLSDSCHSGSAVRAGPPPTPASGRPRAMPTAVARRTYLEHRAFYDRLQQDLAKNAGKPDADPDAALAQLAISPRLESIAVRLKAQVILISGCQDNQTSADGDHNGAFTEQLLAVWNLGKFVGNYARFHRDIKARMAADQTPNLFVLGRAGRFLRQPPFKV